MLRVVLLVFLSAASVLLVWWLLSETGDLPGGPEDDVTLPEAHEGAGHGSGVPGLAHSEGGQTAPTSAADRPFQDITALEDLIGPLREYRSAGAAGARAAELVGGDAARLRVLLRLLLPSAEGRALAGYATMRALSQLVVGMGDPALDVLIGELDHPNAVYRTYIDALIGGFGEKGARAVPRLRQQLLDVPEEPPAAEAASVVNALGAIGRSASDVLPELETWLDEGVTEVVEIAAAGAVVRIGGPGERTWDTCRELLAETNWTHQRQANLQALGELGAEAAPMIPILLSYLEEGILDEGSVFHVLRRVGIPDERLLQHLKSCLQSEENLERAFGVHARTLMSLGDDARGAAFSIARERGPIAQAFLPLAFLGEEVGVPWKALLEQMKGALGAEAPETRLRAAQNLSRFRVLPSDVRVHLARWALADDSAAVRLSGIYLAANAKDLAPGLAALLLACIENPEETVENAMAATDALARRDPWRNDSLYRALSAVHKRHPKSLDVLLHFIPFAATHGQEVLARWDAGIKSGVGHWNWFIPALKLLPEEQLTPYPAARGALEADRLRGR